MPQIVEPPVKQSMPSILSVTQSIVLAAGVVTPTDWTVETSFATLVDYTLMVFVTPPISPSISYVKNKLRLLTTVNGDAEDDFSASLSLPYGAKYPGIALGQKVSVQYVIISNISGEASAPFKADLIVSGT